MHTGPHRGAARRRLLIAGLVMGAIAVVVAACSGGGGLTGETWQLTANTETTPASQGVIPEADQSKYTITFGTDGTWTGQADCNSVNGTYTTSGSDGIDITLGASTMAACPEGSFADLYLAGLDRAETYKVDGSTLTLGLAEGGTFTFAAAE